MLGDFRSCVAAIDPVAGGQLLVAVILCALRATQVRDVLLHIALWSRCSELRRFLYRSARSPRLIDRSEVFFAVPTMVGLFPSPRGPPSSRCLATVPSRESSHRFAHCPPAQWSFAHFPRISLHARETLRQHLRPHPPRAGSLHPTRTLSGHSRRVTARHPFRTIWA